MNHISAPRRKTDSEPTETALKGIYPRTAVTGATQKHLVWVKSEAHLAAEYSDSYQTIQDAARLEFLPR